MRDIERPDNYFYLGQRGSTKGSEMGAQLNIKSEDAYRLASRLAELTGESLTRVVTKALRAELERLERQHDVQARVDRVMEIAKEIRAHMREPVSSDTSWMYDEDGLPK